MNHELKPGETIRIEHNGEYLEISESKFHDLHIRGSMPLKIIPWANNAIEIEFETPDKE